MTVQWTFIGQPRIRKCLKNGESAGIRTQDPRLKRAVPLPIYALQINILKSYCKIIGSQFRQRDFNNFYHLLTPWLGTASIACPDKLGA